MSIGNVIGSNITNLLLILGLSASIQPILFKKEIKYLDIPICIFITIIFVIICNTERKVTFNNGLLLIFMFVCFILYTIAVALKEKEKTEKIIDNEQNGKEKSKSTILNIAYIILGIAALKIGGDLTVNSAVEIAQKLNISEKIISITIVSIGTSLPELVTSVSAAVKKKCDIAIGNIIGSNIFNMLLIIGTTAVINPIEYSTAYNKDAIILIIATIVLELYAFIPPKDKLTRKNGAIYFLMYIAYMLTLFI